MHATDFGVFGNIDLTWNSGAWQGIATGINDAGQISGTQYIGGQAFATIWQNGAAGLIAGAGSYAQAINSHGDVAGLLTASNGQGHAFVTQNGHAVDLGTLPGESWASAYAVNDGGAVAGYGDSGSTMTAFPWSPSTGYILLGTLGGANSYAMTINDSGAAGGAAQTASGALHAVIWSGGSIRDLGTLGGANSFAYGLNNSGEAVGYSFLAGGGRTHGFLYDAGVMLDLNNLIPAGSGWILTQAYAINSSGQIVGAGLFHGVEHAFLLTDPPAAVPEPSTALPAGAAVIALFALAISRSARILRLARPLRR